MGKFDGKVALITGGGSGIGQATALAFAKEGAHIVIGDVSEGGAEKTLAEIQALGGDSLFVRADVSDTDEVKALIYSAVSTYGRLDFAINNAGISGEQHLTHEYPETVFQKVIDVNLMGVWYCMKYEIPQMLSQEAGGVIVNIASVAGLVGTPRGVAYAAAKHAVVGMTKTAALEYARKNVRVNAVCPAFVETPMVTDGEFFKGNKEEITALLSRSNPVRRLGKPEEIASAIMWLCSDDAGFVVGHSLILDGGLTAG